MYISVGWIGLADFENTVDHGSPVIFDADSGLCLSNVQILGPKRNLDHRSFFSLHRTVTEFIQIISFFERSSFKLRCETVIGIALRYSHQACYLLYYLGEINSGIHMCQFTFEPLQRLLFSAVFVVSDLNKNFGGSTDLTEKGNDRRICIPLFISLWLVWASFQTDPAYWADSDSYKLKFEGKNFTSRRRLHWARVVQNPEIVVFEGHRGS